MLTTALALVLLASPAAEPLPADPRAPVPAGAASDAELDFFGAPAAGPTPVERSPEAVATPAPAPRSTPISRNRAPILKGKVPTGFATLDIVQAEVAETWTVTLDGLKVGRLRGAEDRLRVGMVTPGTHRVAIFNNRGTLWSGQVEVRAGQTLVLATKKSGLDASDPMAVKSDAELRQERLARQR